MIVLAMPGAVTRPRQTPALAAAVMRPRVRGSSMLLAPIRLSILRSSSVSPAMLEAVLRSRLITRALAMPLTFGFRLLPRAWLILRSSSLRCRRGLPH